MTQTQPDQRGLWQIAGGHPDLPAVVAPDHAEISFGELAALTNRIANGLRSLGCAPGDQVSTLLPNGIEQLAVTLATQQIGLYVTTVNWHLVGPEIAYILEDSQTKVFVAHEQFAVEAERARAEAGLDAGQCLSVGSIDGFSDFDEFVGSQSADPPEDRRVGSFMFYTSGTTGRPKGVRRPLADSDPDIAAARSGGLFSLFGIEPFADNVQLVCAPLYHTAVNNWAVTSLHLGHRVVLMDRFTPDAALDLMDRYRVTLSHMVPTMFHRMLKLPDDRRTDADLSSLRHMIHAAAPCPIETKHKMLDWWGPVIWEYYAATEGGGTIVSPQEWLAHPGTVGKPWPMSEVVVLDDEGAEVPNGSSGTIYMRMASNEFEYHNDQEKTDAARHEGFFTVGDVGYFNSDGFLFLNDRANDMIIAGGVNLYPAEIEAVLHQHPSIADVAVFGVPDSDVGEQVKAVVQPIAGMAGDDALRSDILAFVGDRLAKQKWPRSIDFSEELPRDPNGKLYKRKLRDPYWEGQERAI